MTAIWIKWLIQKEARLSKVKVRPNPGLPNLLHMTGCILSPSAWATAADKSDDSVYKVLFWLFGGEAN